MRVATFNVNSIRSRLEIVRAWLAANRPDVLAVQETKVTDDLFPALDLREAGYHVVYRGEKSYNGVALLSCAEPRDVRFGLDDSGPADETRLVAARIGAVHVVNTYVPQGREIDDPMYRYKIEWFGRLRRYFERHYTPRQKLIWLGDLNLAPEAMDIHNAEQQANHVCYHVDARRAFANTVSWGFVDVYRKHHPEPGRYSFFDYRQKDAVRENRGWRVDHILATRTLAAKCTDAWIDLKPRKAAQASDHTVVVAEFDG
jgi:exodeoxyribonuclease-3